MKGSSQMNQDDTLTVGILIFDGVEVLDFCGPFEVFSGTTAVDEESQNRPLFRVVTIAEEDKIIPCNGGLLVKPMATIAEHPPLDILLVPGGQVPVSNTRLVEWIGRQDTQTKLTTSV